MKISFFDVDTRELKKYKKKFPDYDLHFSNKSINEEKPGAYSGSDIICIFIHSMIDKDLIRSITNLKFISTRSTGFEHIDTDTCRERGIIVSNVPFYGENTVAEHTFALILSLSRNIHKTYVRTISNNFSTEGIQGFDLREKVIGVIGAGSIGMHVIRMAKGFGMKVLAFDVKKNTFLQEILGFDYVSLEKLLQSSDIISLHAPYNKNTHHIINKGNIKLIKKGAILINTARGSLVENDALVEALDKNILCGAGLDVLEGEEYLLEEGCQCKGDHCAEAGKLIRQNYALLHRENVVITPHNAFNSREAFERVIETTIGNIENFIGGNPVNVVG